MDDPNAALVGLRGYRTLDPDKSAGRRRDILHAAARVFAKKGYHLATTDDIAREMGVTKGVIYYNFRAKEDIFAEVVETAIEGAQARLEAVLKGPGTPAEILRRAIAVHIEYNLSEEDEGYYAMLVIRDLRALSKPKRGRVHSLQRMYARSFTQILRCGMDEGYFVPGEPFVSAIMIITTANAVSEWYRRDLRLTMDEVIKLVSEQLMRSVMAPAGES